jgi:GTPase involved in cell partitioning and DNA repair
MNASDFFGDSDSSKLSLLYQSKFGAVGLPHLGESSNREQSVNFADNCNIIVIAGNGGNSATAGV